MTGNIEDEQVFDREDMKLEMTAYLDLKFIVITATELCVFWVFRQFVESCTS